MCKILSWANVFLKSDFLDFFPTTKGQTKPLHLCLMQYYAISYQATYIVPAGSAG